MPLDPALTLADWRAAYRAGATPRALLGVLRERLAAAGAGPAWITLADTVTLERALAELEHLAAAHPDRAAVLAALPLYGVPFAAKDNIDVAGFPTTAACPAYACTPERDAHAIARLRAAGAVCLGKTNLDQFATGLVGARSPYGRPSSTFSAEHVSGGSSSGSAVVVARGDVPFALGTDTAGSGRVPAGFNNLVGLKPTPGRIGTSGVVPACRTLDCVSIFALTVEDAATVLAVAEGPDPDDAYSRTAPGPAALPAVLRIGVPDEAPLGERSGYAAPFDAAVAHLRTLGHATRPFGLEPLQAVARLLYDGPWVAERHAVVQPLLEARPEALDPVVRRVIEAATRYSATDAFRAQYTLAQARRTLQALWRDVDLLMVPTAPEHPTHAEIDADPIGANARLGTYTNFVNLLGWCALALPAGFTAAGLPFGVTFIAPGDLDAALARFGAAWTASLALPLGATGRPAASGAPSAAASIAETTASTTAPATSGADRTTVESDRAADAAATIAPAGADLPSPATRPTLPIAVVGAHLAGLPLNAQLTERGATLQRATTTASHYRLHALPGTVPPKPGLLRVADGGAAIAVEVWNVPLAELGSFVALIPAPLGLGSLELADGSRVHGFVCEAHAVAGAADISHFGGWRAYLASAEAAA